jgi:hypothetical protein
MKRESRMSKLGREPKHPENAVAINRQHPDRAYSISMPLEAVKAIVYGRISGSA